MKATTDGGFEGKSVEFDNERLLLEVPQKPLIFQGLFYFCAINTEQNILIIGTVWPEPNSSAAGSRMMQLIALFQKQNWKVTFASSASDSEFMVDLKAVRVDKVSIELNNASFDEFVNQLNPDVVVFDRFMIEEQYGWRVAENCPNALRIIDTEDLHCLRYARQQAFKEKRAFQSIDLINDYAKREIASILRCDLALIISSYEMDLLKSFFKVDERLLHYIPFMLDPLPEQDVREWKGFEERKHFATIGNFLHEPNWNSVLYLKEEVWPLIRAVLPDAEMHVYGAYPSRKVFNLHQPKDGFLIKGRAENVKEVLSNARLCLAPLRFGAGLKGKLIDAMKCGTPIVTTSIGSEAMHGNLDWSGLIADTPESIAGAAVKLYSDKLLWENKQKNIAPIINEVYNLNLLGESLIKKMKDLQMNINVHRLKNFLGSVLMHHTLASTKYMSRWIELKNQITKS